MSQKFLEHTKSYVLEMIQQEVAAVGPGLKFHTVRLADGELLNSHAVDLVYVAHRRDAFRGSRILQQRILAEKKLTSSGIPSSPK